MFFLKARLSTRDSVKDSCHAVAHIVFHHILNKKCDDDNAHYWIDKVEPVACSLAKMLCQKMCYGVNKILKKLGCKPADHSHYKCENDHESAFLDVPFTPLDHFCPPFSESIMCLFICQC